ncbi:hypothetical protein PMIN04_001407 [Paraphaeosphaeria minitans]
MFVKVSVLLFLPTIGGTNRWLRWALQANLGLIVTSTVVFCVVIWMQCTPVQRNWDPFVPGRKCIDIEKFMDTTHVLSTITIFTNTVCALMPLPINWRLNLSTKTRIGIILVIGLGLLAAASSVVCIALVKDFKKCSETRPSRFSASAYARSSNSTLIAAASLPPFRALLLRIVSRVRRKIFQDSNCGSSGEPAKTSAGLSDIELKQSGLVAVGAKSRWRRRLLAYAR